LHADPIPGAFIGIFYCTTGQNQLPETKPA
jgi:hypothetical protein